VQADYAKPLAETQTGRFSETSAFYGALISVPECYRVPQRTTAPHGVVLGGRSLVGITSTAAVSRTRHM
jgi:hypothetical protein